MDPRTKLAITFFYAISLFWCKSVLAFAVATVALAAYIGASKIPLSYILKGMKPVWTIIAFTAIFSVFNGTGDPLWQWGFLRITANGLTNTAIMIFRVSFLVVGSSVMTYTTLPLSLMGGLEKTFAFLKIFKVPVADFAMMLSITLRFIPILTEEMDKIMKAQLSRGADFESGNLAKKIKSYVPVFIPLFVSAIRRSAELANAMDARCYNGSEHRTQMNVLQYGKTDIAAFVILALYLAAIFAIRFF